MTAVTRETGLRHGLITGIGMGILLALAGPVQGGWIGATSGATLDAAHDYTNTDNWAGGVVDDSFAGVTLAGATTLYLSGDHATGTNGLNTSYAGAFILTLRGSGGDRTLTLNGDVTHQPVSVQNLTLGNAAGGLNIDLNGITRTFNAVRNIGFTRGVISNGGVIKEGAGTLTLFGANPYTGQTLIHGGTLSLPTTCTIKESSRIHVSAGVLSDAILSAGALANGINDRYGDQADIILAFSDREPPVPHGKSAQWRQYIGPNTDATEDVGRLVLRHGLSKIVQGIDNNSGVKAFVRTDADALIRENRSVAAFFNPRNTPDSATYNNPSIGVRRQSNAASDAGNQVFFTAAPSLVGGATPSRTTASPIIPYLFGVDTTAGNGSYPNTFMTYEAATGLRALRVMPDILGNPPEVISNIVELAADGRDNARITFSQTNTADVAVNALYLWSGALTLVPNTRLTIGSGPLAYDNGDLVANGTCVIDTETNEGIIVLAGPEAWKGRSRTIQAGLAGSGGYTFAPINGGLTLQGTNTYSGQTTILCGSVVFQLAGTAPLNAFLPDDGLVLVHPGAVLQIGFGTDKDYRAQEVIGSLAGGGVVRLGTITKAATAQRQSLIIGTGGSGEPGMITLDGGGISPGMPGEAGILRITTEAYAATGKPIPVTFSNGMVNVDLLGPDEGDLLSTLTNVAINAGGDLVLNVTVDGFTPVAGDEWTIVSSASGPITDGNGGGLFDAISDNSDRVDFTTAISGDARSVVLTAVSGAPAGTVIILR